MARAGNRGTWQEAGRASNDGDGRSVAAPAPVAVAVHSARGWRNWQASEEGEGAWLGGAERSRGSHASPDAAAEREGAPAAVSAG